MADRGRGDGQEGEAAGTQTVDVTVPPASEMVATLVAMGIPQPVAEMAIRETGADTAERAIDWVYENGMGGASEDDLDDDLYQDYKMVFVVNSSLPMTPGKMAAQVGHASIGVYQNLLTKQDIYGGPLLQWNENGGRKIVLQCKDAAQMNELSNHAEREKLPYTVIQDAGYTQIPSGSQTVLAIFGLVKEVDKITGQLKLLP